MISDRFRMGTLNPSSVAKGFSAYRCRMSETLSEFAILFFINRPSDERIAIPHVEPLSQKINTF
jgi:hypothetical protein